MNLEENKIYNGTVVKIVNFGAFVDIANPENPKDIASGLVYISEIAKGYVKDINDFLSVGDNVNVLVIGKNEKGQYRFSIKKALNNSERVERQKEKSIISEVLNDDNHSGDASFEKMMNQFKKISEEKMSDIRRSTDRKNNTRRPKKK